MGKGGGGGEGKKNQKKKKKKQKKKKKKPQKKTKENSKKRPKNTMYEDPGPPLSALMVTGLAFNTNKAKFDFCQLIKLNSVLINLS